MRSGFGLCCLLLLFVDTSTARAATVEGLRLWSGPEATRVVLDLSGPLAHRVFTLSAPDRIVIDLPDAELAAPLGLPQAKGFVTGVRTGERPGGELRVVLDLRAPVKPKSFLLPPNATYGHRLVIDLFAERAAEAVVRRAPRPAADSARDVVIAIDAGHGGEDPGAIGRGGLREKDAVLEIARRLGEAVQREAGMRPLMIRDGDYFVSLRERTELARKAQADLFVSIHADSYRDRSTSGATVYVLSNKGASDEAARRLAERENASDLIGGVSLSDKDELLARVLLDLSQSAAISASVTAGDRVIKSLSQITPMRKTVVQRAPFRVLKSPDIPSILVETAYISNPKEEAVLRDPTQQRLIAQAIHVGLLNYLRDHPPPNTLMAIHPPKEPRPPIRHVISRGETLSGIAERYNVSLSTLKHFNNLNGDVIRTGQVLAIPSI